MIVRCSECNAAYSVEDKKIKNKKFGFSCPKCGASVIIDNRQALEERGSDLQLDENYAMEGTPGLDEEGLSAGIDDFPAQVRDEKIDTDDEFALKDDFQESGTTALIEDEPLESLDDIDAMLSSEEKGSEITNEPDIDMSSLEDVLEDGTDESLVDDSDEQIEDEPLIVDDFESGLDLDEVELADSKAISHEVMGEEEDEPLKLEDFESGFDEQVSPGADKTTLLNEEDIIAELDDIEIPEAEGKEKHRLSGEMDDISTADQIDFDQIIMDEEQALSGKAGSQKGVDEAGDLLDDISDLEIGSGEEIKSDEVFSKSTQDADESITIDLDSLDIELEETEGIVSSGLDEVPDIDIDEISSESGSAPDEDMDTTIDLDSLDITLEEEEELKRGIELDDDERLNLGDAGLSLDQLGTEAAMRDSRDEIERETLGEDEDIKLSIEEIDPSLSVDDLTGDVNAGEHLITDDFGTDKLPEIDMEELADNEVSVYSPPLEENEERLTSLVNEKSLAQESEDFLDIESRKEFARYQSELDTEERGLGDVVPGGSINFSVDYSLSYSRLGAFLRLTGLFAVGLFPRLIAALVYVMVTSVASAFNWASVLFTGDSQDDYSELQEKTIRTMISLGACASGIVEDMPSYTGRKSIDYPLQMNVIYPVRYSRLFAFLRLSVVGMLVIMLPHLLLLTLLSLGALLIYIAGMVSVLAIRKWPTILFDFMSRYYGYLSSVLAFMWGLVDRYPSFRFD